MLHKLMENDTFQSYVDLEGWSIYIQYAATQLKKVKNVWVAIL